MRRVPFLIFLLAVFLVATANASPKHRAKAHSRVTSASAAHSTPESIRSKAAHAPRHSGAGRRAHAHLHPAVLRHRGRHASTAAAAEPTSPGDAPAPEEQAVVETASLSMRRAMKASPLRGSLESLTRQNDKTVADNLERIEDDEDLNDRIARGMLAPLPASSALVVNGKLPENRRYCRPWAAAFLSELASAHQDEFHHPLVVSSAVRTVAYQKKLMRTNGNAAQAEGDVASPHLTGAAVDLAKQGMSRQELGWMRSRLLALQDSGKIDVEEEFHQSCFHITVYKSYAEAAQPSEAAVTKAETAEKP